MCELLGMECNVLTDIVFSFAGLSARGGRHGPHADGWGLALYDGPVARVFLEPAAASDSPLATFVREHPIKTLLAIAHVRRKTRGPEISMVFQDALSSLNPVYSVGYQIGEMFRVHRGASRADAKKRAIELMDRVHIPADRKSVV